MIDKASVLIDREVRMSFDPGTTNFAIGTPEGRMIDEP
jgi:hypothetical protein